MDERLFVVKTAPCEYATNRDSCPPLGFGLGCDGCLGDDVRLDPSSRIEVDRMPLPTLSGRLPFYVERLSENGESSQ